VLAARLLRMRCLRVSTAEKKSGQADVAVVSRVVAWKRPVQVQMIKLLKLERASPLRHIARHGHVRVTPLQYSA
jgi:hypothetical protein